MAFVSPGIVGLRSCQRLDFLSKLIFTIAENSGVGIGLPRRSFCNLTLTYGMKVLYNVGTITRQE